MTARAQIVERATNYLVSLDGLNRVVGLYWTRRFLGRHPEYFKRKQKPPAVERKSAHNLKDMEEYSETFHKLVEWFGLTSEDMWNMDVIGFRINVARQNGL